MDINRKEIGKQAEYHACVFLQKQGLSLLDQNYNCRHGEIDLIMLDQDDIVFVEVRSRSRRDYGGAAESINKKKQLKLIKTATHFLQKRKCLYKVSSRFDVIAIQWTADDWQLEWIKNAFSAR
jgi:putative endonuclease